MANTFDSAVGKYYKSCKLINDRSYSDACELLSTIELQYPHSIWAMKSKVLMIYALYMRGKYVEAERSGKIFLVNYPNNKYSPYVMFMVALSIFRTSPIIERDQTASNEAMIAFEELIRKHPKSIYTEQALKYIYVIKDFLAANQNKIGIYHQKTNEHLSALCSFAKVLEDYQDTRHYKEAQYRSVASLLALNLYKEACEIYNNMLKENKDSFWTKKAQEIMKIS